MLGKKLLDAVRLVNLTFHHVTVYRDDHIVVSLPASGPPARVSDVATPNGHVDVNGVEVPLIAVSSQGLVTDLPDPVPGVGYIVSRLTAAAAGRPDLYFPYGEVRKNGVQIGCRALGQFTSGTPSGD